MKHLPVSFRLSSLSGAAFLMATSAVGPGFITQTTVFTQQHRYAFGFVILASLVIDVLVQWNIWRAIAHHRKYAPVIAEQVFRGSGKLLTLLIVAGGLLFNMGNLAGCGLALQVMFGLPPVWGALLSLFVVAIIFFKQAFGTALDSFTKWLGIIMLVLLLVTAWRHPLQTGPLLRGVVMPGEWPIMSMLTLVGGTVGGYISFAGAHRMLDAAEGRALEERQVRRQAFVGIGLSGLVRLLLFLAVLGVVEAGYSLAAQNPAASVFQASWGAFGRWIFGVVFWCAAITSVVGASYTCASFTRSLVVFSRFPSRHIVLFFAGASMLLFALWGQPVRVLVFAGAANAIVLPLGLALMLWSMRGETRGRLMVLWWLGWLAVALVSWLAISSWLKLM